MTAVITFCRPCIDGTHHCADLFTDPHLGLVACDCDPCHHAFNRDFWQRHSNP